MPDPAPPTEAQSDDDARLPAVVVVVVASVLTALLAVWAAFLVPLRVGTIPLPVSLTLLVAVLALGMLAGRAAGWLGALGPTVAWFVVTLPLSTPRREGDLIIQGSTIGTLYLLLGTLGWGLVVAAAAVRRPAATPADPGRR